MFVALLLTLASPPAFVVENKMPPFVVVNRIAAPEVAARTFPVFNASHNCPKCGREQLRISSGAKGRSQTHTCTYDGTVWFH